MNANVKGISNAGIISGLLDKKGICHDVVEVPDVAKYYGRFVADKGVALILNA